MGRTYTMTIKNGTGEDIVFSEKEGGRPGAPETIKPDGELQKIIDINQTYREYWVGPVLLDQDDFIDYSTITVVKTETGEFKKEGIKREEESKGKKSEQGSYFKWLLGGHFNMKTLKLPWTKRSRGKKPDGASTNSAAVTTPAQAITSPAVTTPAQENTSDAELEEEKQGNGTGSGSGRVAAEEASKAHG
ncbi:hypothetical protein M758_1G233300 [Ceratodon purpureus]|nr:hypothetical protein M758_1G233300 [Ceratodon purpureus]